MPLIAVQIPRKSMSKIAQLLAGLCPTKRLFAPKDRGEIAQNAAIGEIGEAGMLCAHKAPDDTQHNRCAKESAEKDVDW